MAINKTEPAHKILMKAYGRLKKDNPSISIRAVASRMGISPNFLGAVFKGKKRLPGDRVNRLTELLKMDSIAKMKLEKALLFDTIKLSGQASLAPRIFESTEKSASVESRDERPIREFSVYKNWYHVALLDLVTCSDFSADPVWIGNRLGISSFLAKRALEDLIENGLIEIKNEIYLKANMVIRYPTTRSMQTIRDYHKEMLSKALQVMLLKTDDASFNLRLITAISFAANTAAIEKGKKRLMELIYEIADLMCDGDCTEVYQLNVQLFPVTKMSAIRKQDNSTD